jgi:multiple sugar transport system permease protein
MAREGWGMRTRRQVAHAAIYSLLVAVTAIMLFPVAWMLTVSVRPNVEVMKIPPQWIPTVFTWAPI